MGILDQFSIIEIPKNFSVSEFRVLKRSLSFNLYSAAELGYPLFVQFFLSYDKTQIAVRPCAKTDPNSYCFFPEDLAKGKKIRSIAARLGDVIINIRNTMGWQVDQKMIVPGSYIQEDNMLLFDMKQAYEKGKRQNNENPYAIQVIHPSTPFSVIPKNVIDF